MGEPAPEASRKLLDRGIDSMQEFDLRIEVAVVDNVEDLALDDAFDPLKIGDHARLRVDVAADGHFQDVVMSMPTGIGARPKNLEVVRIIPVGAVETMSRRERNAARDRQR